MTFVVEVSNPYRSDGNAYERWEVESLTALADRIESETGWARTECDEIARAVAKGSHFEDEHPETGRTVEARQVERMEV